MKKRYLYALLFGMPGLFVSGLISLAAFGASLGILWIYVFGDNPWPASAETILSILFILVFLILWIALIALGYTIGKRLEAYPRVNKRHILKSSLVLPLWSHLHSLALPARASVRAVQVSCPSWLSFFPPNTGEPQ